MSYLKMPPSLEGIYKDKKEEFYVDKAILDSEADVRLSIIKEIHDRIQGPEQKHAGGHGQTLNTISREAPSSTQ